MAARKALGRKARFEVFKRDNFTCQYCGGTAPDVLLVVDHIKPVAEGGDNDPLNLVTACQPCNAGKGARPLDDSTAVEKQRAQLEALQERREQLDMMLDWKRELLDLDGETAARVSAVWSEMTPGWHVNELGLRNVGKWIRKYGASAVLDAFRVAADTYLRFKPDGKCTAESVDHAWKKLPGILVTTERAKRDPWIHDLYRLKGRIKGLYPYLEDWKIVTTLEGAFRAGADANAISEALMASDSWYELTEQLGELRGGNG